MRVNGRVGRLSVIRNRVLRTVAEQGGPMKQFEADLQQGHDGVLRVRRRGGAPVSREVRQQVVGEHHSCCHALLAAGLGRDAVDQPGLELREWLPRPQAAQVADQREVTRDDEYS